jgi:hypothetical protein
LNRNFHHLIAARARSDHPDLGEGRREVLATPRTREPNERNILRLRQNQTRGGKVLWIGTLISSLHVGHGAVMLIWSNVAQRCWPHLAHANLMSEGFRGKDSGAIGHRGTVILIGTVIISSAPSGSQSVFRKCARKR